MKEKIIARLRALYPGVNLSKARLDAIADKLKVTEETDIDEKLTDLNEIFPFSELAKQDDRVRTLEAKEKKKEESKSEETQQQETPAKTEDDVPAWAKALIEQNKTFAEKINGFESGKTTESRKLKLEEKLKDAPAKFKESILKNFARISFESDDAFEEYLTEVETDSKAFSQEQSDQSLAGAGTPFKVSTPGSKVASKEEIAELSKSLKR